MLKLQGSANWTATLTSQQSKLIYNEIVKYYDNLHTRMIDKLLHPTYNG